MAVSEDDKPEAPAEQKSWWQRAKEGVAGTINDIKNSKVTKQLEAGAARAGHPMTVGDVGSGVIGAVPGLGTIVEAGIGISNKVDAAGNAGRKIGETADKAVQGFNKEAQKKGYHAVADGRGNTRIVTKEEQYSGDRQATAQHRAEVERLAGNHKTPAAQAEASGQKVLAADGTHVDRIQRADVGKVPAGAAGQVTALDHAKVEATVAIAAAQVSAAQVDHAAADRPAAKMKQQFRTAHHFDKDTLKSALSQINGMNNQGGKAEAMMDLAADKVASVPTGPGVM